LRKTCLAAIVDSAVTDQPDTTWIFTDSRSSCQAGTASAHDHQKAAESANLPFFSVVLLCDLEENRRRLTGRTTSATKTKLTDEAILNKVREEEDLFRFRNEKELEVDVTHRSAEDVALLIYEHIKHHVISS